MAEQPMASSVPIFFLLGLGLGLSLLALFIWGMARLCQRSPALRVAIVFPVIMVLLVGLFGFFTMSGDFTAEERKNSNVWTGNKDMAALEVDEEFVGPPEPDFPRGVAAVPPAPNEPRASEATAGRASAWVGIGPILLALVVLVVWGLVRASKGVGTPTFDVGQVIGVVVAGVFVVMIALALLYPALARRPAKAAQPADDLESLTWTESGAGSKRGDATARAIDKLRGRMSTYARTNFKLDWRPSRQFVTEHLQPKIIDERDLDLGNDRQGNPLGLARQVTVEATVPADVGPTVQQQFRVDTRESRIILAAKVIGGLFVGAAFLCLFLHLASSRLFLVCAGVLLFVLPIGGLVYHRLAAEHAARWQQEIEMQREHAKQMEAESLKKAAAQP